MSVADNDIYDLNLQYLLVLQRTARSSVKEAELRFGVSEAHAMRIRDAGIRELQELAHATVTVMQPRPFFTDLLAETNHADARPGSILRSISGA
ncbi:MAG TPA: flagellar transcriptional regulator FlhD [Azospirillum sp.]|nr:flagellar transcriptional regulator FlhD [Azospirillum sp.]